MGFLSDERASSVQNKSLNLKQTPADIWEYDDAMKTDSPKLSLKDGWSMVDILYPIGAFYTQYPDADSSTLATAFPDAYRPADLFGGTWVAQWDTEGIDFHTERISDTGLQTRTDGKQADQMQRITGRVSADIGAGANGAFSWARNTSTKDGGATGFGEVLFDSAKSPSARTGTVTCDSNRLVRIWKRTA